MKKMVSSLIILLINFSPFIFGQNPTPGSSQATEDDAVIKVTTVNIGLPITVFNEKGKFVPNLKRENFRVFENNQPQTIVEFHAQAEVPLHIALLMDTSTSVRNRLEFEKAAIKYFLNSILQSEKDRVAFFTFDTNVELREDFTNQLGKMIKTVDEIKVAGGQTSLYDAIYKVCREKMSRSTTRRRVVLAISDGADTNSTHTLTQTIMAAQRTETTVYAISTKGGAAFRVEGTPYLNTDDRDLRRLCRETGGEVFFPNSAQELKDSFQQITDFLRNQYWLVYEPASNDDGKFHEIDVRVVGQKGLSVLTRRGYLAK